MFRGGKKIVLARYPYTINKIKNWSGECWVAESVVLENCFGLGDTQERAVARLIDSEWDWLKSAMSQLLPIPETTARTE